MAFEGWEASDHLKDDTPETPPVNCLVVALLLDDLRGEILGCAADGHGLFVLKVQSFAQPEVGHLNVTCLVQ